MSRTLWLALTLAGCASAGPRLPLYMEPLPDGRFLARGTGYAAILAGDGIEMRHADARVRLRFQGTRAAAGEALERLPGHSNYLLGRADTWRHGVPHFGRVRYANAWPGIDIVYYGAGSQVEYDFIVQPRRDPSAIAIHAPGAKLAGDGRLLVDTLTGRAVQAAPVVYQQLGEKRVKVPGRYVRRGKEVFGFELGAYRRDLPLVIDPVLSFATFLGGEGTDVANAVAVDSAANIYVTGQTTTTGFVSGLPAGGNGDAYVAKLSPAGNSLAYITYVGGSGTDLATGIAVDAAGNVYIAGDSNSTNLPVTAGALNPICCGVFVAKLNATGSAFHYLTFVTAGSSSAIAIDGAGSAYLTGTSSAGFPATPLAYQRTYAGANDAFVVKVNAAGTALAYATLLGGNANDAGTSIAVDPTGAAYVTGYSESSVFPVTIGAFQPANAGMRDAFVTKLSPDGSSLHYSTLLGSAVNDDSRGIAVDGAGNAYIAGRTESTSFPTVPGSYLTSVVSGFAPYGFAVKLNSAGTALAYGTYLGSSGGSVDGPMAVAVDVNGSAYFTGSTETGEFPTTPNAFQAARGGVQDAFVARLNASGSIMQFATHLGGSGADFGRAIALDTAGNMYVAGTTSSTNFPVTGVVFQATKGAGQDAFIAKIDNSSQSCGYVLSSSSHTVPAGASASAFTVTAGSGCAWFASSNASWIVITAGASRVGTGAVEFSIAANDSTSPRSGTITVAGQTFTVNQPGSPCTYALAPSSITFDADGGIASIAVNAPSGCAWTATSPLPWATITQGASGTGSGTVRYSVSANTGPARSGSMTVAGQTFTVSQGGTGCIYTVTPPSLNVGAEGAAGAVTVNAPAGCPWTASSNVSWASVTSAATGVGPGTVQYTVGTNAGVARSGALSIAGQTFTINQSPAGCTISIDPGTMTLPDTGGSFAATIRGVAGCAWTATTSVPWISLATTSGTGAGVLQFSVSPNGTSAPRSGFIVVGSQALVVTQHSPNQPTCGFSLSMRDRVAAQTGENGTVDLSAASGSCQWTANSTVPWLQLFPLSGQGPARITYTVYPNYTTSPRSTTAVIAGLTFNVVQPGSTMTANERFVAQMYFNFFGRTPSPAEIAFHTSFLNSGTPRGALAQNFFNSEEFNISGRFIAGLYVGILARDAEYGGWLFQRNALATGGGQPEGFVANFLNSAEYALKFGNMSNEQFVVTLYRNILLREPDPLEIQFQASALSGGVPRATMAASFLNSPEFRLGTGSRLTSFLLYSVLLMRGPATAEIAGRVAQLQSGTPVRAIIDDFLASPEFAALLQ